MSHSSSSPYCEGASMDHGISLLPDCSPQVRSGADYHRDVLDLAELAEAAGLAYVKMTEHYLMAYGGYCPSPLAFLAAVAARTREIRLLTGCILPAFHHPVQVASEASMVDAISNGRLDVGFARAYLPYEFETFQVPMDGSRERFIATVETVQRLWSEESVSVDTPYFAFRDATVLPRPTQDPHPPIWIAAVRSRQSFAWTGEHGYGLLVSPSLTPLSEMADHIAVYRESYEAAGHPGSPRVLASLPLFVARTEEQAQAQAEPLLAEYLRVWADSTDSWTASASTDYAGYTGMSRAIRALTPASFRELGSAVVGSPASVTERIPQIALELDCDGFLWQCDFGAVDGKTARASLELFCSDVLPTVRGRSTVRGLATV